MLDPSPTADLPSVAAAAQYVGSAEHKNYPSPAGPPRLRADATKCDSARHGDYSLLNEWLREAISAGRVSQKWEGQFPRYAWGHYDGAWFEARLVNSELGDYKGYQLLDSEVPRDLIGG